MSRSVVLVTGGAGFIGSHVVDRLRAAGHRPRILDTRPSPWHDATEVDTVIGDIRRPEDVVSALRGCDAVCHLAAVADVADVLAHPAWTTELNATGTLNVLEAARQVEVRRVVYASTVWVYSDVKAPVVDEDTPLALPAHLYTAGKLSGELYCRAYGELYGVESTILRFGIPYGPRARPTAVIPAFVSHALRGEPLSIAGSGDQERAFVYVEDLADGVVRALAPCAAGRTYNLTGHETTTIRELADLVCAEIAPTAIVHTPGRSGDLRGAVVRSERAATELGWSATTPLREGVRRYATWLAAQSVPAEVARAAQTPRPPASPVRGTAGRLAGAALEPVFAGAAAMVAVAAAIVVLVLGTDGDARISAMTLLGAAMLMPLWSLTTSTWPVRRGGQSAVIAALAAVSILLLGALSSGDLASPEPDDVWVWLLFSAGVSSALHIVPRRLLAAGS